jgi:hypothetical protein
MSLYEYVKSSPIRLRDSFGYQTAPGAVAPPPVAPPIPGPPVTPANPCDVEEILRQLNFDDPVDEIMKRLGFGPSTGPRWVTPLLKWGGLIGGSLQFLDWKSDTPSSQLDQALDMLDDKQTPGEFLEGLVLQAFWSLPWEYLQSDWDLIQQALMDHFAGPGLVGPEGDPEDDEPLEFRQDELDSKQNPFEMQYEDSVLRNLLFKDGYDGPGIGGVAVGTAVEMTSVTR